MVFINIVVTKQNLAILIDLYFADKSNYNYFTKNDNISNLQFTFTQG